MASSGSQSPSEYSSGISHRRSIERASSQSVRLVVDGYEYRRKFGFAARAFPDNLG
jgi:hypothetical protein